MSVIKLCDQSGRVTLTDPRALPLSAAFLWNKHMMIHMNCRGYANAQFMQPEPAKYARHAFLEAVTFMQPEQPYYAHHPGRFFYIKDDDTGEFFSVPYEPARQAYDSFEFISEASKIQWCIDALQLRVELSLSLPTDDCAELWQCQVTNLGTDNRNISVYSYFPFGYMSWMHQGAEYNSELNGIIAKSITPYQKLEGYEQNKHLKDSSYLICNEPADFWDARQSAFEGEGGLHHPTGVQNETLGNSDALYEVPTGALQYRRELKPQQQCTLRFVFGPALHHQEIHTIKQRYLDNVDAFDEEHARHHKKITGPTDVLSINTPDKHFDHFVNHWLARQVYYHGDVNRLSTDPQTRNYLQDNMGASYIKPDITRTAFITALSQQAADGAMPDGILLTEGGELKYINQIPHTDHCAWLPVCLKAYLDETNDYEFLNTIIPFANGETPASVSEHISRAMNWLLSNRDERGLAFIAQGDWCDPMNMVGHKGKGVSAWLTLAMAYALNTWADICSTNGDDEKALTFRAHAARVNCDANTHFWDGHWYARGITDNNVKFGVADDKEGRIFLNPQSWAMLAGAANKEQEKHIIKAIEAQLETPYGPMMLAPAYTQMREDVGRLTQKFPGYTENGSVYNHASAFYIYALYQNGYADRAFKILRQMIPSDDETDIKQRGQLPVFIPNYYRGAYYQHPRTAGRSSQLFNTGTVHWVLRSLIDGLFGLQGTKSGLRISPQLPSDWKDIHIIRKFRGAVFNISMQQKDIRQKHVYLDGKALSSDIIEHIEAGQHYEVKVELPLTEAEE